MPTYRVRSNGALAPTPENDIDAAIAQHFAKFVAAAQRHWAELLSTKPRKAEHRVAIFAGASAQFTGPLSAELSIVGFDAVRVELGWAPPGQGAALEDGLGTYTGRKVSMIPFVLGGRFKVVIPLILGRTKAKVMTLYRRAHKYRGGPNPEEYEAMLDAIRIRRRKLPEHPTITPGIHTGKNWPKLTSRHRTSIFTRAYHAPSVKAPNAYMVFRTMLRHHEGRLWKTAGVPPANTLKALKEAITAGRLSID